MSFHSPRRYPIQMTKTKIPLGGEMLELRHVRDIDALIDRMTPAELADEKIPYYGQLWPASVALARWVWRNLDLKNKEVLDLGCGIGLTGISASKKGGKVFFADYFYEAIDLTRQNIRLNNCTNPEHEFSQMDWRDREFRRMFDCILASDVLYETRNHEPILALLKRCLRKDGVVAISDPKRPTSKLFFEKAKEFFVQEPFEITVQLRDLTLEIDIIQMKRK